MMHSYKLAALAGIAAAGITASANAATIVTFADPAMGPSTPLFEVNSNTALLTGGWTDPGLTLETPGLAAPNYANARFTMTAVALLTPLPFASLGPGQIDLWDSSNNLLMTITFSGGLLSSSFGFGSSEFQGNNVTFSGPILGGDVFTNEAFAFSFANPVATQTGYQATASFTSSANVPAPAGLAALAMGGLAIGRRRRA
jgi:MYXO-CTERM domain-containing protein